MKLNKKIISLCAVIILIVLLFFFLQKSQNSNANNNSKNSGIISTQELNKDDGKTSAGNVEDVAGTSGESKTSSEEKNAKEQDKITSDTSNEHGITVFIKGANFGSKAEIVIDSSKFNKSYKYYQFYSKNKPVSNIESIEKLETTIFPAQDAGSEVVIHLLDGNQKEINKVGIRLVEKK